jgi:hypothetical protein
MSSPYGRSSESVSGGGGNILGGQSTGGFSGAIIGVNTGNSATGNSATGNFSTSGVGNSGTYIQQRSSNYLTDSRGSGVSGVSGLSNRSNKTGGGGGTTYNYQ